MTPVPKHDADGLHVLDPQDSRGLKSRYITVLHELALRRYLPRGDGRLAVDVGCGYGRLTPVLSDLGWTAVGVDPSPELLRYAQAHHPGPEYRLGALPDLPVESASASLLLLQNVLRPLHLLGRLELVRGVGRFLARDGRLVVVENLRRDHPDYVAQEEIDAIFRAEGLRLARRIPLRAARWPGIYLVRYGLVPPRWHERIAEWELDRMARRSGVPRRQYWNVLFDFVLDG